MSDIVLMGATYPSVPAVQLPKAGGGTATFTETAGSQTFTENGTYDVTSLEQAVVDVSGGGGDDGSLKGIIERTATTPTLPSDLTSIGAYAFHSCSNLALTSLPSGITSIGTYAFYGCSNLALTSLPSDLTKIGAYAFQNCPNIALTSLPSGVTSIGNYAFSNCADLTSIACDGVITSLGNNAFVSSSSSYDMQLTSASFPNMAISSLGTVFGSAASQLANHQLAFADIGKTKAIASNAFANCYALATLVLRRTDAICALNNTSAFNNTPMSGRNGATGTVYVPQALIPTYQAATNWKTLYDAGTVTFAAIEGSEYEI